MADFGIRPEIALQAAGPKRTSISDLLGTATKAMEFSRLSELYPELIKKTTAEAATAETGAKQAEMNYQANIAAKVTQGLVSGILNPLVRSAARGERVDPVAFQNMVRESVEQQAKNANIPLARAMEVASEYFAQAEKNPGEYQNFLKEKAFRALDQATQFDKMIPKLVTSPSGAQGERSEAEGIIRPVQTEIPQPSKTQNNLNQSFDTKNQLPFPIRIPGDPRAPAQGEQAATVQGTEYIAKMNEVRARAPANTDRVDRVLQTVDSIISDRTFDAGKFAEFETKARAALGDQNYKLLEKELANLVIEVKQSIGGTTDATTQLVAQATGDVSYPPGVLQKIATQLRADSLGVRLQAEGAQKFLDNGYGEANLARTYRAAWDANADPRVFEALAIFGSDRLSTEAKLAAYKKIAPTTIKDLDIFEKKKANIELMSQTGQLPKKDKK